MAKATAIADMRYKRPGHFRKVDKLLRYLQFREGAVRRETYLETGRYTGDDSEAFPKIDRGWIDHGLGGSYKEISTNLQQMRSRSVLTRTWVISPDPELMQHIPKEQRLEVVQNVTEQTMETFYRENGWGKPEYSGILHEKINKKTGLEEPHAHVVTPGTIPVGDDAEMLGRMNHYVKRPHLLDLQRTVARTFEMEMERVLGRERSQEIIRERDERLAREAKRKKSPRMDWDKLARAHDVFMLLKQDEQRKRQEKEGKKQDKERQRVNYTRMYIRQRTSQQRARRFEQQREQWEINRVVQRETGEDLHQSELLQARYDQEQYAQEQAQRLHQQREREAHPPRPMDDELWHFMPGDKKEEMMHPYELDGNDKARKRWLQNAREQYKDLEQEVVEEYGASLYDGPEIPF